MPPLGKDNLGEIFHSLQREVFDHQGKWVKDPAGNYWWDPFENHTEIVSRGSKQIPIDAGLLTADVKKRVLYVHGGSNDFSIHSDDPERQKSVADFRQFAQGSGIEIR